LHTQSSRFCTIILFQEVEENVQELGRFLRVNPVSGIGNILERGTGKDFLNALVVAGPEINPIGEMKL